MSVFSVKHNQTTSVVGHNFIPVCRVYLGTLKTGSLTHWLVKQHCGKICTTINISLFHLHCLGSDFGISTFKWLDLWNQSKKKIIRLLTNICLVQKLKFMKQGYDWFVDLLDIRMNIHFLIILDRYGDFNEVGVSRTDYINTSVLLQ